jgi:hypothetical protein
LGVSPIASHPMKRANGDLDWKLRLRFHGFPRPNHHASRRADARLRGAPVRICLSASARDRAVPTPNGPINGPMNSPAIHTPRGGTGGRRRAPAGQRMTSRSGPSGSGRSTGSQRASGGANRRSGLATWSGSQIGTSCPPPAHRHRHVLRRAAAPGGNVERAPELGHPLAKRPVFDLTVSHALGERRDLRVGGGHLAPAREERATAPGPGEALAKRQWRAAAPAQRACHTRTCGFWWDLGGRDRGGHGARVTGAREAFDYGPAVNQQPL